ncbi:MAG: ABC transporter permease [Rickettsiales bacterium]|jgi:putative ABC transport system permease protein|nr:ABC transporter permease [Rickettsiales bacterium]
MTFDDILKESWLSISGNKVRSFLTVLGIIIGVMAVVIMVAVGETVQKQIDDQFSSLGTNTIMVRAGAAQAGGVRTQGGRNTLTIDDAAAIGRLPDVMAATPVQNSGAQVVYGNRNWSTQMIGAYPEYTVVQNIEIVKGSFFSMSDIRNATTVVVIGPDISAQLGLPDDPVGQIIRVRNTPFVVMGVTKARGDSAMGSQDDMIIIPVTTLKKRIQGGQFPNSVPMVSLKVYPDAENSLVTEQITQLLRQRHKLKDGAEDDFQIMDMKQMMETMNTIAGFMKMLLIAIASVSLLVGSIGIMNMMLVSVAERTREIGIRKAIGAKERHIVTQFLSESVLISFIGSMIGLIVGVALAQIIGRFVLEFNVPLSIWAPIMSVVVALVVGIASGVMPAFKAARMNPLDALRHE